MCALGKDASVPKSLHHTLNTLQEPGAGLRELAGRAAVGRGRGCGHGWCEALDAGGERRKCRRCGREGEAACASRCGLFRAV